MSLSTILGGLAGGLAGALIWVLVGYFTGYEVGYIAWGVGFLAGMGLRYFASKAGLEENAVQGVTAAVIAIACIVAQQEQQKKELTDARKQFADNFADNMFSAAFQEAFGFWDILWAFLAVGTAYKIGAGAYSNQ